jgi:hypothetical protein
MIKKLILISIFILTPFLVFAADSMVGGTWQFDSIGVKTPSTFNTTWIIWNGCTTAGHTLELRENPSGNLIVKKSCLGANIDDTIIFPGNSGSLNGLEVRTLGSGNVQVRIGKW